MSVSIPFGQRFIGNDHPVLIIAEIGINHEGSYDLCAMMIEAASNSGADAIKFQTIDVGKNTLQVPRVISYLVTAKYLKK
jgi:sialic acid synthase SpsE